MTNLDRLQNENTLKGNSEDSLLPIYILQILKRYSSSEKPLSSQEVMEYLIKDFSIGSFEKSDAQRKKVRRHLDTLHNYYFNCFVKKSEGKTKNAHKWYYDGPKDEFAEQREPVEETLSYEEINFLVDIITSSKIINSKSTNYIVNNLLKKANMSKDERNARLRKIENEKWQKSVNDNLSLMTEDIQTCISDLNKIKFDYEDKKSILVSPHGWCSDENGKCTLIAKVDGADEGEFSLFILSKIENLKKTDSNFRFDDAYFDTNFGKSNDLSIESLFTNIKIITEAIECKKGIEIEYLSYAIIDDRVDVTRIDKRVLPHQLVFNDGKYYLIGYDEEESKINYYRVDLISKLVISSSKINISYYNERKLDELEIAREIEKHPLMLAERDYPIKFKVVESGLNRVIDTFGKNAHGFEVLEETRLIGGLSEKIVKFEVRTTKDEAFRWALANADTMELVSPQDVRDRLARISDPIYQIYTYTLPDKVRENIDYVLKNGTFTISDKIDADTAYETYKELSKTGKLNAVFNISISGEGDFDDLDYLGDFINTKQLTISAPELKTMSWASKLVNVTELNFFESQVKDTSWMKEMKQLKQIMLSESPLSDLSVLSEHEHINFLVISGTEVRDISFIKNFENLYYLGIAACPIDDYSPLLNMRSRLRTLEINKKALEKISKENIMRRHIGVNIKETNDIFYWL